MSQENLELAKRLNAMVRAGDIDGALALIADNLVPTEIHRPLDEPSVFHGREAALSYLPRVRPGVGGRYVDRDPT
jgi:ketosteroid isomerase-like protein